MSEAPAFAPCPHCGKTHGERHLKCPDTDMQIPLEGRLLDGKFRFIKEIGSGGMATVWLALNENVEREVAIKVLRPEITRDAEAVSRFRSEAKAAGRIGNPHICDILDLGLSPIGPYIVMERLVGYDLATLISRKGKLVPWQAVHFVLEALEGLAAAHAVGIVHRDLKPGNIFVHRPIAAAIPSGGDAIVKVMDFGVSKFMDGSSDAQTGSGILLGTPEYMAPEQLAGAGKIDERADIFSIGAILYRAITGQHVFRGDNLRAVLASMAREEITRIDRLEELPDGLGDVIMRCLSRDPEARYPDVRSLITELAPFDKKETRFELTPPGGWDLEEESAKTEIFEGARATPSDPGGRGGFIAGLGVLLIGAAAAWWFLGDDAAPGLPPVAPVIAERVEPVAPTAEPAPDGTGGAPPSPEPTPIINRPPPPPPIDESDTDLVLDADTDEPVEDEAMFEPDEEEPPEDDLEPETGGTRSARPPKEAPEGTARVGSYLVSTNVGPIGDQRSAHAYCAGLGKQRAHGVGGWHLTNPAVGGRVASQRVLRVGRYWTAALWRGKGIVVLLNSGKKVSTKASKRTARPMCVTRG